MSRLTRERQDSIALAAMAGSTTVVAIALSYGADAWRLVAFVVGAVVGLRIVRHNRVADIAELPLADRHATIEPIWATVVRAAIVTAPITFFVVVVALLNPIFGSGAAGFGAALALDRLYSVRLIRRSEGLTSSVLLRRLTRPWLPSRNSNPPEYFRAER